MTLLAADRSTRTETDVLSALGVVDAALATVPTDVTVYRGLSDADLVAASTAIGHQRDLLGALGAAAAGEISRRSAPRFGSRGLAQRHGFRTPVEMIRFTTRSTGREASTAVRAGVLLVEVEHEGQANPVTGEVVIPAEPWMVPVARAVSRGLLPLPAVDAIRAGLGVPDSGVDADSLTEAAARLVVLAVTLDPDQLRKSARSAREELDSAGVGAREEERRGLRSWRMFSNPDGGGRAVVNFDPESWALAKAIYDDVTSPKLSAVRFEGAHSNAIDDALKTDPRTVEQLAFDGMLHLLAAGADADPSVLMGTGAPIVKMIVTADALEKARAARQKVEDAREASTHPAPETIVAANAGLGYIEGQLDAVSIATIQRALEVGTSEVIVFEEHGKAVDPAELASRWASELPDENRGHRLFTKQQKSILAVRDGGCRWPGCDRPPSWCEAHHVRWWGKHRGASRVDNGILLCKHHHLLLHNNGWEIERDPNGAPSTSSHPTGSRTGGAGFVLIPPADIDTERTPRPMPSKSAAWNASYGRRNALS